MNNKYVNIIIMIALAVIIIACEKEVSVSGPQEYEIGRAEYYISTFPPGAAIFVDNKNSGLFTPDTVKWLTEGEHDFTLKLEPYLDYSFSDVTSNTIINTKNYSFYSDSVNFGSIKFESEPNGCTIYLDDSLMNFKTPYTLQNLLPAKYKVKYEYPVHRSDSTSIFVYAGRQSIVNLELPDTSVWVTYNTHNSKINDNTITDILAYDNTLWVGTRHNGIIKIKNGKEEFITKDNSNLPSNIIHRIKEEDNGNIWIATHNGLSRIVGETITNFTTINSSLPSNYISDFDFDSKGSLWVGTQLGLAKYEGNTWKTFTTSNSSIPGDFITSVLIDQNDTLWIGTVAFNTCKFDGVDTWTEYQADELLIGDSVADLIIGNDNRLWVGLVPDLKQGKVGGVYVLEQDSLISVNFNLTNKRINRFYLDDMNKLWIGTRAGVISVTSPSDYKLLTSNSSELPINDILSIAKDKMGNIWFGTNGGGLVKYKIWKE